MPHLLGIFTPFFYLIGPTYYFFVRRASGKEEAFQWYDYLHFLPVLYVFWEWWPVYTWTVEAKLAIIERAYSQDRPAFWTLILANRNTFLSLVYLFVSYQFLKKVNNQTDKYQKRVRWLKQFTLIFGGVLSLKLLLMIIFWLLHLNGTHFELIMILLIAISIHTLGYVVLGKDKVLPELILPKANGKYATSPLSALQIAAYKLKIIDYLEKERPWLNSNFSINELSTTLKIPRHYVSQVLSEGLSTNFYDLLCQYRIAEVKHRLQSSDVQKFSILGIALDCGFKSKSSFNRAFKKVTGTTPSAWLKDNQYPISNF